MLNSLFSRGVVVKDRMADIDPVINLMPIDRSEKSWWVKK